MTVLFFPDYREENPYQTHLADEITALGEPVVAGNQGQLLSILGSYISTDNVSVVHFHWLHPYMYKQGRLTTAVLFMTTLIQILLIRVSGTPVVWTCHNVQSHDADFPKIEFVFKHLFVRSQLCNRVFVHGETVIENLIETYGLPDDTRKKVVVIKHGHYLDDYKNESQMTHARSELCLDESHTVFLFFGQIRPYKCVFRLIEAFKSVAGPDSRLLIVGNPWSDQMEDELQKSTKHDDRIITDLRFVPDDRVHLYMNAADVVVLPYEEITTSGSVILAMSFGKAIVIPQLGFCPDLLDEKGAVMYDPDDPNALTNALQTAKSRNHLAMGEHNYRLIKEHDWETIAEETVAVYRDISSGRR